MKVCLSRMCRKAHVRFLGEWEMETFPTYPTEIFPYFSFFLFGMMALFFKYSSISNLNEMPIFLELI